MSKCRTAMLAAVLISAAGAASAQSCTDPNNLVQNGCFSAYTPTLSTTTGSEEVGPVNGNSNDVSDWSSAGYNMLYVPGTATSGGAVVPEYGNYLSLWGAANGGLNTWDGNGPAGVGGNFFALDGDFETGAITQTVSGLQAGTVYAISFYYAFAQQAGFYGNTTQDLTVSLGSSSKSVPSFLLTSQNFSGWSQDTLYFEATSSTEVLSFLASADIQLPPFALLTDIDMTAAPEPAAWSLMAAGLVGLIGAANLRRRAAPRPAA